MAISSRPIDSSAARDEIVASIRRSLATSEPFDAAHKRHLDHVTTSVSFLVPAGTVVDRFRESLGVLGGHFLLAASEHDAIEYVQSLIEKLAISEVAISDSELVRRIADKITGCKFTTNAPAATLFECGLGITSAQWAIAETGTLVLESERESSRLTSLVPAVHLCVLQASRIRETLGEILELTGNELSRTITFITGASRTSDIELTLAIGVHGPGELHVVVLAGQ